MSDAVRIAFAVAGLIGGLSGIAGAAFTYCNHRNDLRDPRGHREGGKS